MIKKLSIYILVLLNLFIFIAPSYAMGDLPPGKKIELRVLVLKNAASLRLHIKGEYRIADLIKDEVIEEGKYLREKVISVQGLDRKGIKIMPKERTRVYINNRQFRGDIDIVKDDKNKLLVINHIDIEEYLYGVLYHEVSHKWPMEALKAQAITARTYALYQKITTTNKYFDLTSDIYSQVYGGQTSETWRTNQAVNFTRGMVLTYEGKIFPTYFHATCGGYTERAGNVWDIDLPPLYGRKCEYCSFSPHYTWKKDFLTKDIEDRLKKSGYDIKMSSIKILERDSSGRVSKISIKSDKDEVVLTGNKFRLAVGPNLIRSSNFTVKLGGKYIFFEGKGWGHGVGMCQWGAYGMSRKGWKVDNILEFYYPGAKIMRIN
ncbi:MAG: SpoIID/LytB domain-containing protein [Candidatus Omnitrophota bacterium]